MPRSSVGEPSDLWLRGSHHLSHQHQRQAEPQLSWTDQSSEQLEREGDLPPQTSLRMVNKGQMLSVWAKLATSWELLTGHSLR